MEKRLLSLLLWTALFYFVFGPIRDWGESGNFFYIYRWLVDYEYFLLFNTNLISFAGYSFGTYLVFFYTYPKKKYTLGVILFLLCIPLMIAFRYLLQELLMKAIFGFTNYTEGYSLYDYFFDNLYYAFVFTSFGVIVYFLRYSRFKEQQQSDLEIENQKTQLALLRSQLNPHFLFNALNNIYALVYEKSESSLGALEKLSSLLRYSLYEKAELVPLEKEWSFIENYIELEQLRLSFQPSILLDLPATLPAITIPPFSLITFVENAFKHGDLQNIMSPLRIKMELKEEGFIFKIENSINHNEKDATGGIGLTNLQRRLIIFYQDEHKLIIENKNDLFSVTFKIPRSRC